MDNIHDILFSSYPFLKKEPQSVIDDLFQNSKTVSIPSGNQFINENDRCTHLAFILGGSARVYKYGETGREITLYHVEPGELCLLTAMSILNNQPIPASAVTDSDVKGFVVDSRFITIWMDKSSSFRNYMFNLIFNRFNNLVELIDAVTFQKVDQRILDYLQSFGLNEIETTHSKIASEIGTSREVVSRILKDFERKKVLSLSRNKINLIP